VQKLDISITKGEAHWIKYKPYKKKKKKKKKLESLIRTGNNSKSLEDQ